ncbi:MAG: 50S ribosomal protein L24 [Euryarchaeota archaeon]|nr:50S ribosomal protein L24 [Euryarchaeota archaeon]
MVSKQPRKQRKARYDAPLHVRQKYMRAPLSKDLRSKYGRRSAGVIVGDTVEVTRGDHVGTKGEVEKVYLKDGTLVIEGIISTKADGTEMPRPIYPSNVVITALELKDKKRKSILSRSR